MSELLTLENALALLSLTSLEIVLGIDNIVVIAIIVGRLKPEVQKKARQIGLLMAMLMRIGLLLTLSWIMLLTDPLFSVLGHEFSGKDLILIIGGLFLIGKATYEIHHKIEGPGLEETSSKKVASFSMAIAQIAVLDIVFSLDSVITAVGMANHISIMITAIVISIIVMLIFVETISDFIDKHPTIKVLALSFLILIGLMLVVEGVGKHFDKGYIYFAMAFSLFIEMINMRVRTDPQEAEA